MPLHKAVYYPERKNSELDQIDYDIWRDDELSQINIEIRPLDFRETLLYHMEQMNITEPDLVNLCEDVITDRTIQRMLAEDPNGRTKPKRETIILICLAMRLPVSLSVNLVGKAGYSFGDGMTGQRLQKLLQHKLHPVNAKQLINEILKKEKQAA